LRCRLCRVQHISLTARPSIGTLTHACNLATRAAAKQLAEVRSHPKHEHQLRRHKSGGWRCDVCRAQHLGSSDERWRCVKGCDWDCCGDCIPKTLARGPDERYATGGVAVRVLVRMHALPFLIFDI